MVELPVGGWDKLGDFWKELKSLLAKVWEVQPVASPGVLLSSSGSDFLKWCNSLETTVTLALPASALSRERAKTIVESSLSRLTLVLDRISSGGKNERDFWAEAEKLISRIREIQREKKTELPRLRLQMSGLAQHLPCLPYLVRLAGWLGIYEVVVTPLGTPDGKYISEALDCARELGVRLDLGTGSRTAMIVGEASPPASPERERWRAGSLDNRARMALLQTESIFTLSSFRTWLKKSLVRQIPPPDFVDHSRLQATDDKRKSCLFPWNWTYITENGEINPCPASRRVLGDLREKNFSEIWNSSEYRFFRKRLLSPYPLEECRRCTLRGWFIPWEITDWLWVGLNDQFGVQLGTGWYEREGKAPYRWSRKEANILLKNSGKKRLALVLHLPGRKLAQSGEVWINGEKAGDFSLIIRPGDSLVHYFVPPSENEDILVKLICHRELVPHKILNNNDWRRLGIAFKGAFLRI